MEMEFYTMMVSIGKEGLQIQGDCNISAELAEQSREHSEKLIKFRIALSGKLPECGRLLHN